MKARFLFGVIIALSLSANAQKKNTTTKSDTKSGDGINTFHKNQTDLNLGFGFFRNYHYYGRSYYKSTFPISLSVDHGITDNISIGGYLAYSRTIFKYSGSWNGVNGLYSYTDTYTWSYYIVGLRAAYHIGQELNVENLDLYGGLMVGNNFTKRKYSSTNPDNSRVISYNDTYGGLVIGLYAGGRYLFTDKIGVFGEFGYGLSYGTVGLNIKLTN